MFSWCVRGFGFSQREVLVSSPRNVKCALEGALLTKGLSFNKRLERQACYSHIMHNDIHINFLYLPERMHVA